MNNVSRPVMIMAGGTGGHVYPALAVASELKQRGIPVVWMGTRKGIEARLVPAAGIDIEWLGMHGLRGKGVVTLLLAPLKIIAACYQAMKIIRKVKPAVVLGMGGFVSAPGGLMSWVMRVPLVIHEQNAVPGMSNRLLARIAKRVLEAFPGSFKIKSEHVGNPVRDEIKSLPIPERRYEKRQGALNVLVFGGSLGAMRLNEIVPQSFAKLEGGQVFNIRHQAGPGHFDQTRENYSHLNISADVMEYIDDMSSMYEWADIVICRAGAMTVSELAVAGVASILVPYPYAVDDHQTANAKYLSDQGAAILIQQKDLNVDVLTAVLNEMNREKILSMAITARSLGMPDSTLKVTDICMAQGGYHVN